MRIDRRLVLIGVMLIVLSMTMATQYATTEVAYSFAIVHPSNADIRFIASDISSDDGVRVLRITNNNTGSQYLTVELGDFAPGQKKNYTCAFGIVNEEPYYVNISHVNITGTNASYMSIWLHGDRDADVSNDGTAVRVVNGGSAVFTENDVAWTLASGDGNTNTMNASSADISTPWDTSANVKYCEDDTDAVNGTSDFVWVQISLDFPTDAALAASATGQIYIHFKATTIS